MLSFMKIFLLTFLLSTSVFAQKELALTFDDAPGDVTLHFRPQERTSLLIKKLKNLNFPPVIIFANPCNGDGPASNLVQLKEFKAAGHIIGNHTCRHKRVDDLGSLKFMEDTLEADLLLQDLMIQPKLFRFPHFNEGTDAKVRDSIRSWLKQQNYLNISSSLENEDPIFSAKINAAKSKNKKINYEKVKQVFLKHITEGVEFYDQLAINVLGRSPKHIILLHDKDATVLFIEDLVKALREKGWKIISAEEAIKDPLYAMEPKNLNSTYGILGQVAQDKFGKFTPYYDFKKLKSDIDLAIDSK